LMPIGETLEHGIFGETPNIAARLQAISDPNTVVLADDTRKRVGNLFEFRDLGFKELKGIRRQVRIWRALRANSVPSRFEALHANGLNIFVGREPELEILERCLERAHSRLCVVDLVAEAGIGKSRLIHEFRQRVKKESAVIIGGSCSP